MLPRSAVEFGAMGPPNEDALTHTELGYVQDGSTGPEGTSFAVFGHGEQMPAGHGVEAQYRGDGASMHQGYAQCAYAGASRSTLSGMAHKPLAGRGSLKEYCAIARHTCPHPA